MKARSEEGASPTVSPDVRMTGANLTLEFWSKEQPANFEETFEVTARFAPSEWLLENGQPVTRSQMMMVLTTLNHWS